jgi:hypothetical protein
MIPRAASKTLHELTVGYPVVTITGPRQSGKTTLGRAAFPGKPFASLEEPDVRELAAGDPRAFLSGFPEVAVIDEAQRCPELFLYIQARVDRERRMGQYVLTGSQQFGLLSGVSQSLAGRAGILQLLPFSVAELQSAGLEVPDLPGLLFKGLYPPLYDRPLSPKKWYADYALTYVERDLRRMLMIRDLISFQRFLHMCAARTGQLLNLSGLASDCGISHNTARSWLSVLEASYLVFLLPPHTRNFGKRLVKPPSCISWTQAWPHGCSTSRTPITCPFTSTRRPVRIPDSLRVSEGSLQPWTELEPVLLARQHGK